MKNVTPSDGGYGLLQEVEFFTGTPSEKGHYLVARYRTNNSPRDAGRFVDVTVHWFDGNHWLVGVYNEMYLEIRYWAYVPGDPEKESV